MKNARIARKRETLQVVCDFCGAVAAVDIPDCDEVHAINAAIDKGLTDQGWKVGERSYRCADCRPKRGRKGSRETAAEAYARNRADIAAIMDWLGQELDRHEEEADGDPRNWGFAGSLAEVRGKLKDTLAFISETADADIEKALDELRA